MYTLHFDGLFRGVSAKTNPSLNAGFMCYGWLVTEGDAVLARGHGVFARGRDATSNIAEYLALLEGLDALLDLGLAREPVLVCGDAKCVIEQMQGLAEVNSIRIKPIYQRAVNLARKFSHLDWRWQPRKLNYQADSLTRRAMRQVRLDDKSFQAAIKVIDPHSKNHSRSGKFLSLLDLRVYLPMKA